MDPREVVGASIIPFHVPFSVICHTSLGRHQRSDAPTDTLLDALFTSLLEASTTPVSTGLPAAAARAVATLVFVAPDAVVPRAISQIVVDLDPVCL